MNKYQAIYQWFNSFGIPFYVDTNVPNEKEITYPYGTYQNITDTWAKSVSITVRLYYRSTSEVEINKMADKIGASLKDGGQRILCDDGMMWLTTGTPFCQAILDDTDTTIKSRYININVEYLTV